MEQNYQTVVGQYDADATVVVPRFDSQAASTASMVVPLEDVGLVPRLFSRSRDYISWSLALILVSASIGGAIGGLALGLYQRRQQQARRTSAVLSAPAATAQATPPSDTVMEEQEPPQIDSSTTEEQEAVNGSLSEMTIVSASRSDVASEAGDSREERHSMKERSPTDAASSRKAVVVNAPRHKSSEENKRVANEGGRYDRDNKVNSSPERDIPVKNDKPSAIKATQAQASVSSARIESNLPMLRRDQVRARRIENSVNDAGQQPRKTPALRRIDRVRDIFEGEPEP